MKSRWMIRLGDSLEQGAMKSAERVDDLDVSMVKGRILSHTWREN